MTDRVTATIALLLLAASTLAAESHVHARPVNIPAAGKIGFEQMNPAETGILFTNFLSDPRSVVGRNLLSGSGVACGDIDGDGLCDIYFCGLDSENKLFRNLGNWKFEDITASAGSIIACVGQDSMGAAFADVDGDGDLDLLVNALGNGTRLFTNDGKGAFTETTSGAGVASGAGSMSMALADVDGDGDLDLYVANFRPGTMQDEPRMRYRIAYVD